MNVQTRLVGRNEGFSKAPAAHRGGLVAAALFCLTLCALAGPAAAADKLRIGAQKTGTFAWELAVIRKAGLDARAGLDLEITDLASTEAGKVALMGGSVDIILSDWLWVARERGLSANLTFSPYSAAVGAVMAPPESPIQSLDGLRGKTLGVAGGPLDKSWLMLRAFTQRDGLDLKARAKVVFAAPPLLFEKALSKELDASLNYWNFAVALEARGFRRVIGIDDIERQLGAKGPIAMVGYVFDEGFAQSHGAALDRFLKIAREAKDLLAGSDADWARIGKEIGVADANELALYRAAYSAGIPRRPVAEEAADAAALYAVLREIGGPELLGAATTLNPGTFYKSADAADH